MPTIAWYQQNEEITGEGVFLEGEAAMRDDMALFADEGAPDTESAEFLSWEAEDRDEAIIEASVSDALFAWMMDPANDVPVVD